MFKVGDRVWLVDEKQFAKIVSDECLTDYGERYPVFNEEIDLLYKHKCQISKSADDMFKELGYENQGGDEWQNDKLNKTIYFDCERTVSCFSYHSSIPTTRPEEMTMEELKASYQMCIEKGWIE